MNLRSVMLANITLYSENAQQLKSSPEDKMCINHSILQTSC